MTILLLGATGRTGQWLLKLALEKGYFVHALVRDENKLAVRHPSLKIFSGTPTDEAALNKAMTGCEAVLSALNISREWDFPWAKLRTPSHFLSNTMRIVIKLAAEHQIQRVIIISAWGVGESRKEIPGWFNWMIDHSNIKPAYDDHLRQEELLKASALQWTIVRPVGLTNSKKTRAVYTSINNNPKPRLTVSRKSLAGFILEEFSKNAFVGQLPVLFN